MTRVLALRHGQEDIPCPTHALTAYQFAVARGDEWIRVEKPGHVCDFNVAALGAAMRAHPLETPHSIVWAPLAEHQRLGSTFDTHSPHWRGATFTPRVGG